MTGLYIVNGTELSIGRLEPCQIVCRSYLEMSGVHVLIKKLENNIINSDVFLEKTELVMEGRNGGYVNDKFVRRGDVVSIEFGDEIRICGLSLIWMDKYIAISSELFVEITLKEYTGDDEPATKYYELKPFYSKPPRPLYSLNDDVIELELPPEKHIDEGQQLFMTIGPAFTMALPMLLGFFVSRMAAKSEGGMSSAFMYTGLITAVTSAILGVIWGIVNIRNRRAQVVKQEAKRKAAYTDYVIECEKLIRERYNKNVSTLRMKYPELGEYLGNSYNKFILWNKSPNDSDYLCIRVGIGNIVRELDINIPKEHFSLVEDDLRSLPKRLKNQYALLRDVPITIDLSTQKCSGIVCESKRARDELFLIIILSLAVSISPEEMHFALLFEGEEISKSVIESVRFLPHLSHMNRTLIASDAVKIADIISDLNQILEDDLQSQIIIFTDCYEKIRLKMNDTKNVAYVLVSAKFEELASDCRLIIQKNSEFSGSIQLTNENAIRTAIHFDTVSNSEAVKYSRILQSIRIRENKGSFSLPNKVSYYELFGKVIKTTDILDFWERNSTTKEIVAPVGIGDDGQILSLNLHESGVGPHGLVSGMTGSGKSEILQTIILSLCVRYSPENIGFFLIDYKGGGMSDLFDGIPHVMGSISNLSGSMIQRAMVSIKSENERRQRIFASCGVNNISEYQIAYSSGIVSEPLPHVFIIIDEFAELKREEPEFMKGVISVARVGRSLGIHLILATQKPAGVIDDNIQSNSRFRICLKLQDKSDSMEVLHKPDAAFLTNPGRAILQVGNDEIYMSFQGAYTMSKNTGIKKVNEVYITNPQGEKYIPIKENYEKDHEGVAQLRCVVDEIKKASFERPAVNITPLWLSPLDNGIVYEGELDYRNKYDISIGIYDDPSHQIQNRLVINIVNTGHHIILGTLGSGKSTLLSTISYALLNISDRDFLNMYFIDFSHGMLNPYRDFVYTGGYICEENEKEVKKLIMLLNKIIGERKELLKGGNFRQYISGDKSDTPKIPAIFLIIDGFGAFRERTEGVFDKDIEQILKNGESLGIYIIASANSISSQELPRRFMELFKVCLPLQLKDKYEYKEALLAQADEVVMPDSICGRGLVKLNTEVLEFQAFKTVDAENDFERQAILNRRVAQINERISYEKSDTDYVRYVPTIPKILNTNSFIEEIHKRKIELVGLTGGIPIGFFEDSGEVFFLPYEPNLVVVITGRIGSGKANLLKVIKHVLREANINEESIENDFQDELKLCFKNGMAVYLYDEKQPFEWLSNVKSLAGDDPYVIHLGGAIDRQNFADYSYIPFSKQMQMKAPGFGTVRKTLRGYEFGEVVFPNYS